jgi:type I restriction enzyme M protein
MLWFLDRGKPSTSRADSILFIDAREVFTKVDRAHREFTSGQVESVTNIVRLYRGEPVETHLITPDMPIGPAGTPLSWRRTFPDGHYHDVEGLCRAATLAEVEAQDYSLNPGRYVGARKNEQHDRDFDESMASLMEEFDLLTSEARELEDRVKQRSSMIVEGE